MNEGRFTLAQLAELAGMTVEDVRQYVDAGVLAPYAGRDRAVHGAQPASAGACADRGHPPRRSQAGDRIRRPPLSLRRLALRQSGPARAGDVRRLRRRPRDHVRGIRAALRSLGAPAPCTRPADSQGRPTDAGSAETARAPGSRLHVSLRRRPLPRREHAADGRGASAELRRGVRRPAARRPARRSWRCWSVRRRPAVRSSRPWRRSCTGSTGAITRPPSSTRPSSSSKRSWSRPATRPTGRPTRLRSRFSTSAATSASATRRRTRWAPTSRRSSRGSCGVHDSTAAGPSSSSVKA